MLPKTSDQSSMSSLGPNPVKGHLFPAEPYSTDTPQSQGVDSEEKPLREDRLPAKSLNRRSTLQSCSSDVGPESSSPDEDSSDEGEDCSPEDFNRSSSCPSADRDTCHDPREPVGAPRGSSPLSLRASNLTFQKAEDCPLNKTLTCPSSLLRSRLKSLPSPSSSSISDAGGPYDPTLSVAGRDPWGRQESTGTIETVDSSASFSPHPQPLSPLGHGSRQSRHVAACRSATSSPDSRAREGPRGHRSPLCPDSDRILTAGSRSRTVFDRVSSLQESQALSPLERRAARRRRSVDVGQASLLRQESHISGGLDSFSRLSIERQSSVLIERSAPRIIERQRRRHSGSFSSGELSLEESWARANCILVPSNGPQSPGPQTSSPVKRATTTLAGSVPAGTSPLRTVHSSSSSINTAGCASPGQPKGLCPGSQACVSTGQQRTESPFDRRQRRLCAAQRDNMSLEETLQAMNLIAGGGPRGSSPARYAGNVPARNVLMSGGSPLRSGPARSASNCSPLRSALRQTTSGVPKASMMKSASVSEAGVALAVTTKESPDQMRGKPLSKQVQFKSVVEEWERPQTLLKLVSESKP